MPLPAVGALIGGLLRGGGAALARGGAVLGRIAGRQAVAGAVETRAARGAAALGKSSTDRVVAQAIERNARRSRPFGPAQNIVDRFARGPRNAQDQPGRSRQAAAVGKQVVDQMFSRSLQRGDRSQSWGQRATQFVVRFVNPNAGSSPGQQREQPTPSISALAARNPSTMTALMSGKLSPQQAIQNAQQSQGQDQEEEEAARSKVKSSLTGLATAAVAGTSALVLVPLAGKKLAESLVGANERLARFNGTIANAYAKLGREDLIRSRQSAAATAGTTAELTEAVSQMRDELRPVSDVVTNVLNEIGAGFAIMVKNSVAIAKGLAKYIPGIGEIAENTAPKKKIQRTDWEQWFVGTANAERERRKNGPLPGP